MKKILFLLAVLVQTVASAQISMTVPNGSFEQWTSHQGYSVTAIIFPISVYGSYSTPTGWDYLSYPVNESVSVYGMNININTDLPLIKATQESGLVPDSSSAVKLQTFMLSDIISSTVYSMAAGSIDTMLTNMVFPSILSTGTMDIDHFIPIITDLMSNMDSLESLLMTLLNSDVNYYFNGGLPLNGFEPTRLTGSYKYHSAVSGDNGGVVILGTRYNSALSKREIVGGGFNIALTDCTEYTPFTVDYMSLHEYDASFALQDPDSLIVLLVSSASLDRQQGSWLCVDNLALWHDTCADIAGFTAVSDIHEAVLNWNGDASVDAFEMEYGPAGFATGSGIPVTVFDTTYMLLGLFANTQYEVHLRTLCGTSIYGGWDTVVFTTLPDTCTHVVNLHTEAVPDSPGEYELLWTGYSEPYVWVVEYGLRGFEHGTGAVLTLNEPVLNLSLLGLRGNNWYDIYVRSLCGNNVYGEWSMVQFHTDPDTCARVVAIVVDSSAAALTPDNMVSGYVADWQSTFEPGAWEVEYGIGNGQYTSVTSQQPSLEFPLLQPGSWYELRVRAVCDDSIYGNWESIEFRTMDTMADTTPVVSIATAFATSDFRYTVSPNPANGRCVVSLCDMPTAKLRLYTSEGRLLQVVANVSQTATLCLPSPGVFLLQIITPEGAMSGKIVNR